MTKKQNYFLIIIFIILHILIYFLSDSVDLYSYSQNISILGMFECLLILIAIAFDSIILVFGIFHIWNFLGDE